MKFIILFILTFTFCVQAQSDELICNKIFNEITEKSPIKNTSPSVIELEIKDNILKSFIWDSQKIEMHFEILFDHDFDLKIGSKGYSDINNAVFFELDKDNGYLFQYLKSGVSYKCSAIKLSLIHI